MVAVVFKYVNPAEDLSERSDSSLRLSFGAQPGSQSL